MSVYYPYLTSILHIVPYRTNITYKTSGDCAAGRSGPAYVYVDSFDSSTSSLHLPACHAVDRASPSFSVPILFTTAPSITYYLPHGSPFLFCCPGCLPNPPRCPA